MTCRRPAPWRRTLGAVSLLALTACGGSSAEQRATPNVFDLAHDPTSAIAVFDASAADVMPADLLRSRLEKELTWHGIALTQAMRAAHAGDASMDAWIAELSTNTDDLTSAIGLVYGRDAAFAFHQQWGQHTQFLVDYAVALATDDEDAAASARERLGRFGDDAGSFFAAVTANALPADAVRELLDNHVTHMVAMIDAVDGGDDAAALGHAIEDAAYLGTIAQGLSTAFAAQNSRAFPGTVETPESQRATLIVREAGSYVLRELMAPGGDAGAAFEAATQLPLADVIGVIDQLQAADPVLVADSADLALDRAFEYARPAITS